MRETLPPDGSLTAAQREQLLGVEQPPDIPALRAALSEKAAEHTSDYYAAVGRVQERLAEYMETARENGPAAGEQVTFEEEVSAGQRLVVTIRLTGEEDTDGAPDGENEAEPAAPDGENETESAAPDEDDDAAAAPGYEVTQWQMQSDEEWEPDRSLDVYQ